MSKSAKKNREFANEVSRISVNAGCELHVARNVLRWKMNNWKPKHVDYTYGLTAKQLMGPTARKIQFGTDSKRDNGVWKEEHFAKDTGAGCLSYDMGLEDGSYVMHKGTLYTLHEWMLMNR